MSEETLITTGTQTTDAGQQTATAAATATPGTPASPEAGAAAADATNPGDASASEASAAKPEDAAKPEGAPEQYADFVAPEGVTLDAELSGDLKAAAKELGLSQANAQKLADLGVKLSQKQAAAQAEALATARTEWASASQTDKEFGGDKLTENLAVAKKSLETFATPELRQMLNESGLGNHPEVVRLFYRVGKAISQDGFVQGGRQASPGIIGSAAQRMYPGMNP